MPALRFARVAAIVFGLVALAHIARIALGAPLTVGDTAIPMAASYVGAAVTGALCVLGLRARG